MDKPSAPPAGRAMAEDEAQRPTLLRQSFCSFLIAVLDRCLRPVLGAGENREDGANPSRGRRCVRPGPRMMHATAARREGDPGSATSREPEDLPVELLFGCSGQ